MRMWASFEGGSTGCLIRCWRNVCSFCVSENSGCVQVYKPQPGKAAGRSGGVLPCRKGHVPVFGPPMGWSASTQSGLLSRLQRRRPTDRAPWRGRVLAAEWQAAV